MLISWNTTKKCNLYCKHCYRDSGPDADTESELSTEEGIKLLNEIKSAGFKLMIFSGGEPLYRDDIFVLASYAKEIGLRPVLGTNGTMITDKVAQRIKASGIDGLAISLDSVTSEYHDEFRNLTGSWDKAVNGIKCCVEADLRVQINITLTEENFDQFEKMADFVMSLGVKALHPFFLIPTGRGKNIEEESLKQEKYFNTLRTILEKQKSLPIELKPTCAPQFLPLAREMGIPMRFTRGCLAGVSYCCILPNGDVNICPYLPVKAGNIRENPFDVIWKDSSIFNQLRSYKDYEGRCGKCSDVNICGGCRARAYYYNDGNYMAEEPWCYKFLGC
ncbi:MAG: radical SAM protein [Bacillota bacterium]